MIEHLRWLTKRIARRAQAGWWTGKTIHVVTVREQVLLHNGVLVKFTKPPTFVGKLG